MESEKRLQELRVSLIYMEYDARKLGLTVTPTLLSAARNEVEDHLARNFGVAAEGNGDSSQSNGSGSIPIGRRT